MGNQNVFANEKELGRLSTQNKLMYRCEGPIFQSIFAGKRDLHVLDVGSNDGEKSFQWFSDPAVSRVLGLELDAALAEHAQKTFGGDKFSFYSCDVENERFPTRLEEIRQREGLDGFDVIYISFLLSHLKAPDALLRQLRPLLNAGGVLVAVDSDDSTCSLEPEGGGLLREYLAFMAQDPFCGDRSLGRRLPEILRSCGYCDAVRRGGPIVAGPEEPEQRRCICDTYALLEEDLPLLRESFPNEALYDRMEQWLAQNLAELKRCFLAENARVSMGITVVVSAANADIPRTKGA